MAKNHKRKKGYRAKQERKRERRESRRAERLRAAGDARPASEIANAMIDSHTEGGSHGR